MLPALQNYDDGDKNTGRAYGHALVVGLSKEPRKVWPRAPSSFCPAAALVHPPGPHFLNRSRATRVLRMRTVDESSG